MLLGQIVAISFASNLFFVAVLLSSDTKSFNGKKHRAERKQDKNERSSQSSASISSESSFEDEQKQLGPCEISRNSTWLPSSTLYTIPVLSVFFSVFLIPHYVHTYLFLPLLAVSHVLLFIPVTIHAISPRRWGSAQPSYAYMLKHHHYIYRLILWPSLFLFMKATFAVLLDMKRGTTDRSFPCSTPLALTFVNQIWQYFSGDRAFPSELFDHPAVSSVGWDVILCWVSAVTWLATQSTGSWTLFDGIQLSGKLAPKLTDVYLKPRQAKFESSKSE